MLGGARCFGWCRGAFGWWPVAVFMDWTFPASFVELNTMVLAPIVAGCTDNPAVAATIAGCAALSLLAGAFQALPSD